MLLKPRSNHTTPPFTMLQQLSVSLGGRANALTLASTVLNDHPLLPSVDSPSPAHTAFCYSGLLTVSQISQSSPTQGLCPCGSLCLECSSPTFLHYTDPMFHSLSFPRSLVQCHSSKRGFSCHTTLNSKPDPEGTHFPALLTSRMHITSEHAIYLLVYWFIVSPTRLQSS